MEIIAFEQSNLFFKMWGPLKKNKSKCLKSLSIDYNRSPNGEHVEYTIVILIDTHKIVMYHKFTNHNH